MEAEQDGLLSSNRAANLPDTPKRTIQKIDKRLLTLCASMTFLSYLDRGNVGYAANDLCRELHLTNTDYGLGVSLFYAGYLATQFTGNIFLGRLGAPAWCAILMFSWGSIAAISASIQNATQFYAVRFLLGVAEGGAFPAIWYLNVIFYPPEFLAGACSVVASASLFSMPVSAPISAGLIALGPSVDMDGWRLLFLVEGLIPVLFAGVLYFLMPSSPETASFLTSEEKQWIASKQGASSAGQSGSYLDDVKVVFSSPSWWVAIGAGGILFGMNSVLMFWATLLIHEALYGDADPAGEDDTCGSEHSNAALAILLTAIPYFLASVFLFVLKRVSVRNRALWTTVGAAVAGLLLICFAGARAVSPSLGVAVLSAAVVASSSVGGLLVSLTLSFLPAQVRRTGAALTNGLPCIGAFAIPPVIGAIMDSCGEGGATFVSGGMYLTMAALAFTLNDPLVNQTLSIVVKDKDLAEA